MKLTSLLLALLASLSGIAQTEEEDTTRIQFRDQQIVITRNGSTDTVERKFGKNKTKSYDKAPIAPYAHWAGIEFGINGLIGSNYSFDLPTEASDYKLNYAKSWFVNLNFPEFRVDFYKEYIGMVTGLGFSFNMYDFKRPTTLLANSDMTWTVQDTVHSFKKNKLRVTYLTLPLLIEINANRHNPDKSFHFSFGVIGGLRIGSKTTQKYNEMSSEFKIENKSHFNMNPVRAQATARIGFSAFSAFMNYTFTRLFEKNKGPEMYPIEFGVGLYLP